MGYWTHIKFFRTPFLTAEVRDLIYDAFFLILDYHTLSFWFLAPEEQFQSYILKKGVIAWLASEICKVVG